MHKSRLSKYLKGNYKDVDKAVEQRGLTPPDSYIVASIQDLLDASQGDERDGERYAALAYTPLFNYGVMKLMAYEDGVIKDLVQSDLDCLVKDGIITPYTLRYWYANRAGDNAYLLTEYGEFFVPE